MKKLLTLAVATLFITNIWAYQLQVENESFKEISGVATYASIFCRDSSFKVAPKSIYQEDKGGCCIKTITINGEVITPRRTGFNITCKTVRILVEGIPIVVEGAVEERLIIKEAYTII